MSSRGLVLVGPRGAGKSATAPLVAARLGLPCLDADDELERATGRSIAELFARGELRGAEARLLARLLSGPPAVLAAGGGCVLWEGFRDAARGWAVAWLDAAPDVLAARLARDARPRPSLTGRPPHEEVGAVAREREGLYRGASHARFDTTARTPEQVADAVVSWWRRTPGAGAPSRR